MSGFRGLVRLACACSGRPALPAGRLYSHLDFRSMEKRVVFGHKTLPYLLLAPQIIITIVFFFLPAGQAMWQSLRLEDAFGLSSEFVGLANFADLFSQQSYLDSFRVTAVFSALVAFVGLAVSLLLAVMADRVLRGAGLYKTLLIWPYAVAPAVVGVLWLFLFSPSVGILAVALNGMGVNWNPASMATRPSSWC